jgi:putative addiction module antidote
MRGEVPPIPHRSIGAVAVACHGDTMGNNVPILPVESGRVPFLEQMMTKKTTIRAVGNSAGATIPKAMLERYHLSEGDQVNLVETPDGILITPYDQTFADAIEIYQEGAREYRNAMRRLAE